MPGVIDESQPACEFNPATGQNDNCRAQKIWSAVYDDYNTRREVCQVPISSTSRVSLLDLVTNLLRIYAKLLIEKEDRPSEKVL